MKQRECPWRREIKKRKTVPDFEESKRRDLIRKMRHAETREKTNELLQKRKEVRQNMLKKEEEKEKRIQENRKLRLAERRNKKKHSEYE